MPGRERIEPVRDLERAGLDLAHELKNPLCAVKALVQPGLRNPAESASRSRLALLEREITRMQELLLGLLSSGGAQDRMTGSGFA